MSRTKQEQIVLDFIDAYRVNEGVGFARKYRVNRARRLFPAKRQMDLFDEAAGAMDAMLQRALSNPRTCV
jgi:hypothetical protein